MCTWKYLIEYPLTGANTITTTTVIPCTPNTPGPAPISYVGTLVPKPVWASVWSCSKTFAIPKRVWSIFDIYCAGLKPSTQHVFKVDGGNMTSWCSTIVVPDGPQTQAVFDADVLQIRNALGQNPLVTDTHGKLNFTFLANIPIVTAVGKAYDPNSVFGSSGYSVLSVEAPNSVAKYLIGVRSANKTLAPNPAAAP